jgi:hypothetical protein
MTFLDNRTQAALLRQPITPGKVLPDLYSLIYMIYLLAYLDNMVGLFIEDA